MHRRRRPTIRIRHQGRCWVSRKKGEDDAGTSRNYTLFQKEAPRMGVHPFFKTNRFYTSQGRRRACDIETKKKKFQIFKIYKYFRERPPY